jgi:beta-fructofuranosidase
LEIDATFTVKNAQKFGFILYANEDGSEYTKVYYDALTREMVVDQSHSTLKEHIPLNIRKEKYELDISKEVRFHIYIDGSVAEFFINSEAAYTTRVFPLKENSDQVKIFTENGSASVSIRSWALKTANMETDF